MDLDRTFAWHGREVAWTRIGDGPPVVLCHGTPWSSALWAPVAEALATRYSVHVWDMPGYGHSSKRPDDAVDLGTQGQLFGDLLDEWGLDAPHVVAHDFGGAVSLRAHLLHGRDYASLCLVDVVALRPWGSPFFTLVRDNADVFTRLPPTIHAGAIGAYIETASHRGLHPDDREMLLSPWLGDDGQAAFYRQIAQADERFTEEFESQLSSMRTPVHIIWGEQDTWIPPDRAERLAAAISGSTVRMVPEAGHLIQLDAPAILMAEIDRWLASR